MAFCTSCGAKLEENEKFCSYCGSAVPQEEPQPFEEQEQVFGENEDFEQEPIITYELESDGPEEETEVENKRGVKYRSIPKCLILTIVTCGLYGLYWFLCIINDLNFASEETDDADAATVVLLTLVTCGIYGWIWLYKAGAKVDKIRQMNGEVSGNTSLIYILLALCQLSIVDYILIQLELNKVANKK